ncbi:MAG: DNA primase [Clostridia bacterium]|nr:DNA primase [Clostridia bacterium]
MIPREVIEDIVARSEIEQVIGSYVTLKRAGSNLNGLCPFHSEKSPSFTVFPNTQSFYCFGCSAGGDVITFIERAEHLDYIGAVEFLAARAGIDIPQDGKGSGPGRKNELTRRRVCEMNLAAAKFFRQCLFDPAIGGEAMRYLSEQRRLSGATIKHFGLGYAPATFGMLTDYMHKLGYTDEELITAFLCGKSQKTGRAYDYFRNRVMFPIIDTSGNIIAFGGRVMDDSKPKYLNSSDTPAFKKSRNLFALNYARNHCEEFMILCEGYMDVIALHAAGFENAVATLGTAITAEQARIFAKYTKKVIISYDSDEAGQRAANRAMQQLGEVGIDVRVLQMNGAKDPDEYIKLYGADKFRRLLSVSRTGFAYKSEQILAKYDIETPEGRIAASGECCQLISEYNSGVEREVYIGQISQRLNLSTDVLKGRVDQLLRKRIKESREAQSRRAQADIRGVGDRINPDTIKNVQASSAESVVLGLLMIFDEYRSSVLSGEVALCEDDFFTAFGKRAFTAIMELQKAPTGYAHALLGQNFSPEEMGRLQQMEQQRRALSRNGPEVFRQSAAALKDAKARSDGRASEDVLSSIADILARKAVKNSKNTPAQ